MENKADVEKGTEKSHLLISDWITYLSSEKSTISSGITGFFAISVALIAMLFSMVEKGWASILANAIIAVGLIIFVFVYKIGPVKKRGIDAENILERIMSGELISEESIHNEWMNALKKNPKGSPTSTNQ